MALNGTVSVEIVFCDSSSPVNAHGTPAAGRVRDSFAAAAWPVDMQRGLPSTLLPLTTVGVDTHPDKPTSPHINTPW